jgi:hypothetical protein
MLIAVALVLTIAACSTESGQSPANNPAAFKEEPVKVPTSTPVSYQMQISGMT